MFKHYNFKSKDNVGLLQAHCTVTRLNSEREFSTTRTSSTRNSILFARISSTYSFFDHKLCYIGKQLLYRTMTIVFDSNRLFVQFLRKIGGAVNEGRNRFNNYHRNELGSILNVPWCSRILIFNGKKSKNKRRSFHAGFLQNSTPAN